MSVSTSTFRANYSPSKRAPVNANASPRPRRRSREDAETSFRKTREQGERSAQRPALESTKQQQHNESRPPPRPALWSGTDRSLGGPGGRMVRHGHVPGRVWGGICFANRRPPGSRLEGKLPQRDRSSGLAGTSGMPPQVSCAGDGTGELAPSLAASVESSGAALAPHLEVPVGKAGARAPGEAAPGSHRLAQRDSRQGSYPLPPGEATWTKPAAPPGPPGEGGGAGGGTGSRGCR